MLDFELQVLDCRWWFSSIKNGVRVRFHVSIRMNGWLGLPWMGLCLIRVRMTGWVSVVVRVRVRVGRWGW